MFVFNSESNPNKRRSKKYINLFWCKYLIRMENAMTLTEWYKNDTFVNNNNAIWAFFKWRKIKRKKKNTKQLHPQAISFQCHYLCSLRAALIRSILVFHSNMLFMFSIMPLTVVSYLVTCIYRGLERDIKFKLLWIKKHSQFCVKWYFTHPKILVRS